MNRNRPLDSPQAARPFPWRPVLAVGIAALVLILYWPATGFGFINLDDPAYVQDNPHVATGLSWENLRQAFHPYQQWWLPLLWISFMLDTVLFGTAPFGYHLVNVLLHALNAALLFWVLARMTKSIWPAAFVAALFAVHPLRVEAVAWITARKDVLSGLFYMLALLAYLRHAERPSAARLALVAGLMLLGLMSKAILITLPPLLLLLDFWPLRRAGDPLDRREWRNWARLVLEKIPLILLAAVFTGINLFTHTNGRGDFYDLSVGTRLALIPPNYWEHLAKIVWPHPLAMLYPEHDVIVPWITGLALLGLVLATVAALRLRNRIPALAVGWLWFLVALFPVIRGLRLGMTSIADRFTYIPAIGLFLMLAWTAPRLLPPRRASRALLATAALAILAACAVATRAYLPLWRASEPLYRHALAVTRDNYIIAITLSGEYAKQGRTEERIAALRFAEQVHPGCAIAYANLANALRPTDPAEATRYLELADRYVRPFESDLYFVIGEQYALDRNYPKAIQRFRQALAVDPGMTNAIIHLGTALFLSGQPGEALPYLDQMLWLQPRNDRALFFRGQALLALDRPAEAAQALQAAANLLPEKVEYKSMLAVALSASGQGPEAVSLLRNLIQDNPESPELLNNLASILAENQASPVYSPGEAVELARQAAELTRHQDPRILDTLAMAYAANGQCDLALPVCAEAEPLAKKLGLPDLADRIRARAEACRNNLLRP